MSCYKEAIESVLNGTFTEEKKDQWDERLSTVFNRGFWDGYYQGQKMGEWTKDYGNKATEKKVLIGKVIKYFSRLGVAEVAVEANTFVKGEKLLITGNSTGAMFLNRGKKSVTTSILLIKQNKVGVFQSLYRTRFARMINV